LNTRDQLQRLKSNRDLALCYPHARRVEKAVDRRRHAMITLFAKCPFCGRVVTDEEVELDRVDLPCPYCGKSGVAREVWPDSIEVHQLLDTVTGRNLEARSERTAAAREIIRAVELMFGAVLKDALWVRSPRDLSGVTDGVMSHEARIELFSHLAGRSFESVLREQGFDEFENDLLEVRAIADGKRGSEERQVTTIRRVLTSAVAVMAAAHRACRQG